MPTQNAPRDEELMRQVAEGSAEALGLLYRRFARVIARLAVQSLIAEDPTLAALPEGLEVTLEPRTGSAAPSGPVVVAWEP